MMKFKLNLNEVKYIINEVAKILTEITVQDAANKYYRDIPSDDFMEIVTAVQGGIFVVFNLHEMFSISNQNLFSFCLSLLLK